MSRILEIPVLVERSTTPIHATSNDPTKLFWPTAASSFEGNPSYANILSRQRGLLTRWSSVGLDDVDFPVEQKLSTPIQATNHDPKARFVPTALSSLEGIPTYAEILCRQNVLRKSWTFGRPSAQITMTTLGITACSRCRSLPG